MNRQIVLASHLRPIEKDESITECTKKSGIFNTVASGASGGEGAIKVDSTSRDITSGSLHGETLSKEDFMKKWKVAAETDCRWSVLTSCSIAQLSSTFRVEMPSSLFSEILKCFSERLQANDDDGEAVQFALQFLIAAQNFGRFSLLKTFMSADDKAKLERILTSAGIRESNAELMKRTREIFGLKSP